MPGIAQFSTGDNIRIAFNIYSPLGLIDIFSVKFLTMKIAKIPSKPSLERFHEISLRKVYWEPYERFLSKEKICHDHFSPFLKMVSARCTGVGNIVIEMIYKANSPGNIASKEYFGKDLIIHPRGMPSTNSIKRRGVFHDYDDSPLELHTEDILTLYLIKGD